MDKERLRRFSMGTRWRVRVEEVIRCGEGGRIYWEWCDAEGRSSEGRSVENGQWLLFNDVFIGFAHKPFIRVPGIEDDERAWQKLLEWAKGFGYREE